MRASKFTRLIFAGLWALSSCKSVHSAGVKDISQNPSGQALMLNYMDFPAVHGNSSRALTPFMADVLTHVDATKIDYLWGVDPINTTHEELHGVNEYLRIHYALQQYGALSNGFYLLNNMAVIMPSLGIMKRSMLEFVPALLRAHSSYATYIASDRWDDTPSYIFDEWTAYLAGLEFGIDLASTPGAWARGFGSDQTPRISLEGMLAFTGHALELGLAMERYNPTFLKQNPNFDAFLAYNFKRATMAFYKVKASPRLNQLLGMIGDQDQKLFNCLIGEADCAPLRGYADRHFGAAWTANTLNGKETPLSPAAPERTPTEPTPQPQAQPQTQPEIANTTPAAAPSNQPTKGCWCIVKGNMCGLTTATSDEPLSLLPFNARAGESCNKDFCRQKFADMLEAYCDGILNQ